MVLVKVDAMMMLTACVTAATGMLPVLADTAVAMADVPSQLAGLPLVVARHFCKHNTNDDQKESQRFERLQISNSHLP